MPLGHMNTAKYSRLDAEELSPTSRSPGKTRPALDRACILRHALVLWNIVATLGFVCTLIILGRRSGKLTTSEPSGYVVLAPGLKLPPSTLMTFEPEPEFEGYTNSSNAAWRSLMPKGRGYIGVEKSSIPGLQPGVPVSASLEKYSLSAFHQLHCLAQLRESYYELRQSGADSAHGSGGHGQLGSSESHHHHQDPRHLDHCFDYLRQAIMCAADPALEPARVEEDGSRSQVDGWGGEHQCRNWRMLVDFVVSHRASDESDLTIPH